MGTVGISKVGSNVYLVRLYLRNQFLHDACVTLRDGQFLYLPTLVEWQVEEMDMILMDVVIATGITRLTPTDKPLHGQDGLVVKVTRLLLFQVVHDLLVAYLDHFVGAVGKELVEAVDKVHVQSHLLVGYGDIAAGLIGNMHVVTLLHEPSDGTTHGDDVVVGMR